MLMRQLTKFPIMLLREKWSDMGGTSFLRIESTSFRGLREVPPKLAVSMV